MTPYRRSYGGYRFNWSGFITPAVKTIVLVNTGIFLVQTLIFLLLPQQVTVRFNLELGLVPYAVTHGLRVWQPFTYMFLHGGLFHLLINMFVLWMFGRDLEVSWGRRRFYTYYFVCGVGAGVINILVKTIAEVAGQPPSFTPTIGASGAIFGVLIANAVLFPDRQIWLIPFPISIAMRPYVAIMAAIEFFGTLGSGGDNVSHICHLGGLLVGYIYLRRGQFLFRSRNLLSDWKRRRLKRKFEVYMKDQHKEKPSRPDNWVN
jgi:membrane associated rhomboid family serine protease